MDNQTWTTSIDLLRNLKSSDAEGWERFVHLYTPLIYGWCRKAGLQEADSADVCQEVFRQVAGGIQNLKYDRPEHSFRGWLWTITRRAIAQHYRRAKSLPDGRGGTDSLRKLAEVPDWVDDEQVPESANEEAEVMRRAAELIKGDFEEKTWQAFWLSAVEDLPGQEVSERLGMTKNAVRQAKFRVMNRLREFLGFEGTNT